MAKDETEDLYTKKARYNIRYSLNYGLYRRLYLLYL